MTFFILVAQAISNIYFPIFPTIFPYKHISAYVWSAFIESLREGEKRKRVFTLYIKCSRYCTIQVIPAEAEALIFSGKSRVELLNST